MKKNLCIFIGYTSFTSHKYGTEIAIINLSKHLSRKYNVFIVTLANDDVIFTHDYIYLNYKEINNTTFDVLIISRYINYFTYCFFKCSKTYLWIHDVHTLAYFKSMSFEDNGKALLHHVLSRIDKIILLSDWHKCYFQSYYHIPDKKIKVIGNGIHVSDFLPLEISKKQKNRFIWTSCLTRGIERCIRIIEILHETFPDVELHIFRDFNENNYQEFVQPYIYFHGKLTNQEVIEEFKKSDFWFYPTTFHETFCISALEAQMAGCIAISTDVGSLNTTVGNHGVLLDNTLSESDIAAKVMNIMKNEDLKKILRTKGEKWAREQDWSLITKKWFKLFRRFFW